MKKIKIDYELHDSLLDGMERCRNTVWRALNEAKTKEEKEYWINNYNALNPFWNMIIDKTEVTYFDNFDENKFVVEIK